MSAANTALDQKNNSARSFVTALAINGALLVLEVGGFILLKSHFTRIYEPRTYLPPPTKRAQALPPGIWKWLPAIFVAPSQEIIRKNGLDAYMAIRFFQMMMKLTGVYLLVTWPILLPINAVHVEGGTKDGLAQLAFGNISETQQSRYWAHLICAYVLTFFTLYLIRREWLIFVHNRHQFLISRQHSRLAQAKTVLITNLPAELANNEQDLKEFFSFVPGGISRVWIYRSCPGLPELFEERLEVCKQLEVAATDVMQHAVKADRKASSTTGHRPMLPLAVHANKQDRELAEKAQTESVEAGRFLDTITRPTHRLGRIPFMGQRVDTIDWCTKEIARLNREIDALRETLPNCPPQGSAFVQCNLQMGAHVLAQCVSYHEPLYMAQKWVEVAPEDIIWANIDDSAYEMKFRYILSWAATLGLIVLWALPVAFAGAVSNIDTLCDDYHWLAWVCRSPTLVQGLIQGVFPPVLLAVLFLILPFLLRGLAWFENITRYSLLSISVYKRYYLFLVIHGFLIITLTSGLTAAAGGSAAATAQAATGIASDPKKAVENLAKYLPDANIFFLTYMIQQGFTGAASALLQAGPLIIFFIKRLFFGETPREAYEATFTMPNVDFGEMLPRMSLLATIAIAYSVIAPVINGLALLAFVLFWLTWKFLLIWVMDQPDAQETGGLYFPILISNLFTGIYIQHLCLIGLFFLAQDQHGKQSSFPQGICMVVLMAFTIYAHYFFHAAFSPITDYLPMSLATHKVAEKFKQQRQEGHEGDNEFDLFSRERIRSVVKQRLRLKPRHRMSKSEAKLHDEREKERKKREEIEELAKTNPEKAAKKEAELRAKEAKEAEKIAKGKSKDHLVVDGVEGAAPRVSQESHRTNASVKSDKSGKKDGGVVLGAFAAAQGKGFITLDAPTKALKSPGNDGDDTDDDDDDLEENAFNHPSTYQDQPWIWIPQWEANPALSAQLVEDIKAGGVEASDIGAIIDDHGTVWARRNPPDEDWVGGHDK